MLAEIYAGALRRAGVPATVMPGTGVREVVIPALQQGLIDIVPEYAGTSVRFFGGLLPAVQSRSSVQVNLQEALAGTTSEALRPAHARDSNGVAVRAAGATRREWTRISDPVGGARRLTFGGRRSAPTARCAARPGEHHGLHFRAFITMPTFAATAASSRSGEIDVGLLDTTRHCCEPTSGCSPTTAGRNRPPTWSRCCVARSRRRRPVRFDGHSIRCPRNRPTAD